MIPQSVCHLYVINCRLRSVLIEWVFPFMSTYCHKCDFDVGYKCNCEMFFQVFHLWLIFAIFSLFHNHDKSFRFLSPSRLVKRVNDLTCLFHPYSLYFHWGVNSTRWQLPKWERTTEMDREIEKSRREEYPVLDRRTQERFSRREERTRRTKTSFRIILSSGKSICQ